jgi:hypothetical protein
MNLSTLTTALVQRGFPRKDCDDSGSYTAPPDGRHWHMLPAAESSDGTAWLWVHDAGDDFITLLFGADQHGSIKVIHAVESGRGDAIATLESTEQQSLGQLLRDRKAIAAAYERWCETLTPNGDISSADLAAALPAGWQLGHDLVEGRS